MDGKCYTTNLLIRDQVHDTISELINIFLDYDNVVINDIIFTLLHIKLLKELVEVVDR